MDNNVSSTPYDDVFRTLLTDCTHLIIPVINEVFGEHYSGDEPIGREQNEHFFTKPDGSQEERISDSCLRILQKRYHIECQSRPDQTMVVRMFAYDVQIALAEHQLEDQVLTVDFPESAVLYLRHNSRTPDELLIRIVTRGGEVSYGIPVIKVQTYPLGEIFEKQLLFLLPFYIFRYEKQFAEMKQNQEKRDLLNQDYIQIQTWLAGLEEAGTLDSYTKAAIIAMIRKVVEHIAKKYPTVQEGVNAVMGGKVLDYEAKRIKQSGIEEGRLEGRKEGRKEGRLEGREEGQISALALSVKNLMENLSMTADDAMKAMGISESLWPKLKTML